MSWIQMRGLVGNTDHLISSPPKRARLKTKDSIEIHSDDLSASSNPPRRARLKTKDSIAIHSDDLAARCEHPDK